MTQRNYFIKQGYVPQTRNLTLSTGDGKLYWTPERLFFSHYFQWHAYDFARKVIRRHDLRSVLDLGCGPATKLMKQIHPVCADVTGVDQAEAIAYCKKTYPAGTFVVDDLEAPTVEVKPADAVLCSDVIEHLVDPDAILEYIRQHTTGRAFVVFSTPERDALRGPDCMASKKPEHVREWNKSEFAAYLTDRRFEVLQHVQVPFIKFAWQNKIAKLRNTIRQRCGTIETMQLVLARVRA